MDTIQHLCIQGCVMSTDDSGIAVGSWGQGVSLRSGVLILGICLFRKVLFFSASAELVNTALFLSDLVFCIVKVF